MPLFPHLPSPAKLLETYDQGFEGWIWNLEVERAWEDFWSGTRSLYAATSDPDKLKDLHKKYARVLLWQYRLKFDPRAWHEEAQTTGDCTSHGSRNARDTARCVEIARGDAEVFHARTATEPTYGARGHGGQGMDPARAVRFETEYGFLFREAYRETNLNVTLDLTKYNSNIGANWGRSGVPEGVKELCKRHNVGDSIRITTGLQGLDSLAAGGGIHSGQNWGTSAKQSKDGINTKSAGWSHDMATVGYDLSKEFFKREVVFVANSWEDWNDPNPVWMANQDVYGPWVPGMIVMDFEEWERYFVRSGSCHAYFEIKGIPVKELPWVDLSEVL